MSIKYRINGEKTDPLPLEEVIISSPIVSCCTVIGEGRPCTAALIELSADAIENYDTDTIKEKG